MEKNIAMAAVTPEMIAEWKKKHGDIFKISVDGFDCIVKKPGRKDLSFASSAKDAIKQNEIILNACWLAGDEEIKTDDSLFFAATKRMDELFDIKQADLEKL